MRRLLIRNDPPYGVERSSNGLRLANALAKHDDARVRVFLMGDAARRGTEVGCCGSCIDGPGVDDARLANGARRSSLDELADSTLAADHVIVF